MMAQEPEDVVRFMMNPSSYPDRPNSVRLIETHISWVFLTGSYAYKLKKPVKFEFLDFSTVTLRRDACREELRLNLRLAPNVYIDVLPITQGDDCRLELGGRGNVVDWVVQMRRLPGDKAMDVMLREGHLTAEHESSVAQCLASFYAQLSPEQSAPQSYREAIERHIRANRTALASALPELETRLRRIHSLQLRYLCVDRDAIDERVTSNRIVDGHGDLRPEHIYLETPPAVIDCIEFSEELRRVDIADELCFLDMECQRLGNTSFGQQLLETYQRSCRDEVPSRLLDFYRSYRACVRAKVAVLRDRQLAETEQPSGHVLALQYLDLAEHFTATLGAPCLLIIGGLSGTGKSTLARVIAGAIEVERLSTDSIRRNRFGASSSPADYGDSNYRPEMRSQIYEELNRQANKFLNERLSVILDGTFLSRNHRQQAYELGARHDAISLFVLCECDRETAVSRILNRNETANSESEARAEFYDQQLAEFELAQAGEPTITVNTTQAVSEQLELIYRELRRRLFG